ncbi:MAG: ribosomal protein S19 family protein [Candidatus Marsarchaeota archaeon]|jgi:small subunit ribosomal protein S19|nr:ribosomal protein S19 family protein [Candidatus Marsarchaeota archaeon]MCL5418743.1 ribosomal protein S19 family protein [Candidatus Marsarchaeota archaeon]
MAERIAFRGKTPSELAQLSDQDYVNLVRSRERRSIKRNGLAYKKLLEKVAAAKSTGKMIKTHVREAVIMPSWLGMKFSVYNGKEFVPIEISAGMLGHRLGEFVYTTKRVIHSAPGIKATRGSKFLSVK